MGILFSRRVHAHALTAGCGGGPAAPDLKAPAIDILACAAAAYPAATTRGPVIPSPAVCKARRGGVFELPALLSRAACEATVAAVDDRVARGLSTNRGVSLPTDDVYVHDLPTADALYAAIDAALGIVGFCTGSVAAHVKREAFVVTYDASKQSHLEIHQDTTKGAKITLILSLDAPDSYTGGGTTFYPDGAKKVASKYTVKPRRGGGVAFKGNVWHQGAPVLMGRRHILVVFSKPAAFAEKHAIAAAQKNATKAAVTGTGTPVGRNSIA